MRWISVKARLPDWDYFTVLVAICPPLGMNEVHLGYMYKGKWHIVDEDGNHSDFVTHWMNLPEIPEEE